MDMSRGIEADQSVGADPQLDYFLKFAKHSYDQNDEAISQVVLFFLSTRHFSKNVLDLIDKTAQVIGFSKNWQKLPESDLDFLNKLFAQSIKAFDNDQVASALIGFCIGESLSSRFDNGTAMAKKMRDGQQTCRIKTNSANNFSAIIGNFSGLSSVLNGQSGFAESNTNISTRDIFYRLPLSALSIPYDEGKDYTKNKIDEFIGDANKLFREGHYLQAEMVFDDAQGWLQTLPDNDDLSIRIVRVRLDRLFCLELADSFSQKNLDILNSIKSVLEKIRFISKNDIINFFLLLEQRLIFLQKKEKLTIADCSERLQTLCIWAIDWLDLTKAPTIKTTFDVITSGFSVSRLLSIAESWLAAQGQYAKVVALLAAYHSRYASAYRLSAFTAANGGINDAADSGADPKLAEARAIERLRMDFYANEYALQTLESRSDRQRDTAFATERQSLINKRSRRARKLIESLCDFRADAGFEAGQDDAFHAAHLRPHLAAGHDGGRALVILQCIEEARPTDSDPDATVTRPLALVLGPAAPDWQAVDLPVALLAAVLDPDGRTLIEAVRAAWALIEPRLGAAGEVHIGVHHTLGELPWSSAADGDLPPADVPLAGFNCLRRRLCVHLGVSLAVQALARGPERRVAAPGPGRLLGVLAHSPAANDQEPLPGAEAANRGSQDPSRRNLAFIPGVYADRDITQQSVSHHLVLEDCEDVLASDMPLLQLSCHGEPRSAHTGAGERCLGTYELRHHRRTPPEAVLLFACSTAQAGENAWGEAGGWGAVLGAQVRLCFGALYPVSDTWTPLYTLLLHRAWQGKDLKAAMAEVRARLRSGRWGDSEDAIEEIVEQYKHATASLPKCVATNETPAEMLERMSTSPRSRCALYASDAAPTLRRLTEVFVVYG